ncbi:peptide-methionine (S)-S-oxide reductase [Roseovarius sp. MMSF_3305]|uniref:peptide-methionine (S)-S-oxide reductase n=1 Tax=Roseovarius sp. MMSF_3305 TaxID=3046697 RepID=UPI00273F47D4|nr:peptide-methionine (S)-S-oxide reductase [Roseovarius sp. MMSF_3305]
MSLVKPDKSAAARIGLGGGCHWCTEAVFDGLRGVVRVEQGFIRASVPDDSWSEAIIVHFNPDMIPLETLIEVHLRTHASTSNHKMRGKYRSAVYAMEPGHIPHLKGILRELQDDFEMPLVTRVLDFQGFKPSEDRFQNYHRKNAGGPFCTRYIDPKLDLLRRDYAELVDHGALTAT